MKRFNTRQQNWFHETCYVLKHVFRWILKGLWYTFFFLLIIGIFRSKNDPLKPTTQKDAADAADIVLIMQATGLLNPN